MEEVKFKNVKLEDILESLKLFNYIVGVKLKKQRQYDFLICKEIWVHKIVIGDTIIFITEEDYEKLKLLDFECITID